MHYVQRLEKSLIKMIKGAQHFFFYLSSLLTCFIDKCWIFMILTSGFWPLSVFPASHADCLVDWLTNYVQCNPLPKYATGIKDVLHLCACVCVWGHLLHSTPDLLTPDQSKPTSRISRCHFNKGGGNCGQLAQTMCKYQRGWFVAKYGVTDLWQPSFYIRNQRPLLTNL